MFSSPYDTRPEEALHEARHFPATVLVDFDETLYLRNSTEDFIDSVRPAPFAFLLIRLLDVLKPWRLTGGDATRDVWRVLALLVVMPWSLARWRGQARRLGHEAANRPLVALLISRSEPTAIATLGFAPIVRPLVDAMGLTGVPLVAMPLASFRARRAGKRALVGAALGEDRIRRSLVITDSLDDRDLLAACDRPMRVRWPLARFRPAFRSVYVPGLYITRIKRPRVRFIYRSIISDEFSVWVLASITLAAQPLAHVVGLALLSVSFWAIYETGYVDNDRIGQRHERDPNLSKEFLKRPVRFPAVLPWIWAALCGLAGVAVLCWPAAPAPGDLLLWGSVLAGTFVWFRFYNRLDKHSRIWPFAGLQLLRSTSFVAIVPVTPIGMVALISHALARWVPYYAFRVSGTPYNDDFGGMTRLLFFIVISVFIGLSVGWRPSWTATEFILLGWLAFKARRDFARSLAIVHWIKSEPKGAGRTPSGEGSTG